MRRSITTLVTLAVIGLVLLPAATNIGANAIPDSWTPHLWLAWPVGVLLAVPMIYVEIRDRLRGQHPVTAPPDRAARDLAATVRQQWTVEAGLRGLRSPEPIQVRWSSTGRPVATELWKVLDADVVGRPVRLRGDLRQVIDVFRRTSSRQLVILGRPAAGKSVLALLFVLGLPEDQPVPVLIAVSSWNPHQEDLHAWLARRIVEEYPWLASSEMYGPDATARLITDRLVLPVLDGLDELTEDLLPIAIKAIDRTVADRYPLVITCRTDEYHDAVARNGAFLAHAAVLEIQPVGITDAVSFLTGADPQPERWQPVVDHLRANPEGPQALALRSPLMIDLARTVYNVPSGKPAEMLETTSFADQRDVENHLFDAFLRVAYQNRTMPPGSQPGGTLARYSDERAGTWLNFLAGHLNTIGEQDFAWWRLERGISRPVRGTVVGLITALVFGITTGPFYGPFLGLAYAVTFGLAVGVAGTFGRVREPSRVRLTLRGHLPSLFRRATASLVVGFVMAPVVGTINGIAVASAFMVALTAHLLLDQAPDETTTASPTHSLRQDRSGALLLGAMLLFTFGIVPGVLNDPTSIPELTAPATATTRLIDIFVSLVFGTVMGGFLFGRIGALTIGIAAGIAGGLASGLPFPSQDRQTALVYSISFGIGISMLGVLTRAWGAYTLTRLWLALHGKLPLRLMRFLDDAHRRGVLRQSGTTYQFRHARLHTHITTTPPAPRRRTP